MEVEDSHWSMMENNNSSELMTIKEEEVSDYEDAGDDEGWIAVEGTDTEVMDEGKLIAEAQKKNRADLTSLNANTVQTLETNRWKLSTRENLTDGELQSNGMKCDLHLNEHVKRARKSLKPMKTSNLSRISSPDDLLREKAENGKGSFYYCDECSRFFTSKKLHAMHARHHERGNGSKNTRKNRLDSGHLEDKRDIGKITKVEQEEGSVIDDSLEMRKRLGLRVTRSVPARYRNGADHENLAESGSDDENKSYRRRKQLAPRENEQIIKMESNGDDGSLEADIKKREGKALIRRIREGRPLKLKNKLPNMCPQCGHCFKKKTDLQRHLRVHTGEKPYACEQCNMRFTRNFGLQCHMRTHAGLKLHTCATCGKSYSRRYDLVKHERAIHLGVRNYACGDCDKRFVTAQLLRAHERTHTNSQPYLCQECGHRSNHRSDLKKHMRTHTNERPYCCPICKKSFLQSGTLTSHIAHAHGK